MLCLFCLILNLVCLLTNIIIDIFLLKNDKVYLSILDDYKIYDDNLRNKKILITFVNNFYFGFFTGTLGIEIGKFVLDIISKENTGKSLMKIIVFICVVITAKINANNLEKTLKLLLTKKYLKSNELNLDNLLKKDLAILQKDKHILEYGLSDFYGIKLFGYIKYEIKNKKENENGNKLIGLILYFPSSLTLKNTILPNDTKQLITVQMSKVSKEIVDLNLLNAIFYEDYILRENNLTSIESLIVFDEKNRTPIDIGIIEIEDNTYKEKLKILKGINLEEAKNTLEIIENFKTKKSSYDEDDIEEIIDIYITNENMNKEFKELLYLNNDEIFAMPLIDLKFLKENM